MGWLSYALLAMLAKSGQNFAEKASQKRYGSLLTTFLLVALSTVMIFPFIYFSNPVPTVNATFWIGVIGSSLVYLIAKPLRLFAIGTGDISEIIPLISFSSVFSLIFGWIFLNEIPTKWGLLGVCLVASGGYLMNFEKTEIGLNKLARPIKQMLKHRSQSMLFISLVLGPFTSILDKLAINNTYPRSPHYVLLAENVFTIPLLFFILIARKVSFKGLKNMSSWKIPLILSVFFALSTTASFSAISIGKIGYVAAIKQLSSLVAVVGGVIFLGEGKLKKRLVSAVIMGTGAFIIAYMG